MISEQELQEAIEREFQCERCGNCCKGEGAVSIGRAEARRMARHLGMKLDQFFRAYTMEAKPGEWWLLNQDNEELWCIFLEVDDDGLYGCKVNPAKPDQCGSFPARWTNEDSLRSCAGLRILMRNMRRRKAEAKDLSASAASAAPDKAIKD